MLYCCDVLYESKQKDLNMQTHESAHYGLEIPFKVICIYLYFVAHRERGALQKEDIKD